MRPFAYARPASAAEAVAALAAGGPGTKLLAGGTTLYDLMKLDVERPERVVDWNAVARGASGDAGLSAIEVGEQELVFGALARMSDAAEDAALRERYPALAEGLWKAASQQLRNMASLGGNLLQRTRCAYFRHGEPFACNKRAPGSGCAAVEGISRTHALFGGSEACIATYPGDWATALVAFDAAVDVLGPGGERTIPLAELHREPGDSPEVETTLAPDEAILRVRVPATPSGRASTYHKIRDRESYAFAVVSAAVGLAFEGGVVSEARVALGGVATVPWRSPEAEAVLVGRRLTPDLARAAGDAAFAAAAPTEDNAFKVELGARTVADALLIAQGRA